MNINYTIEDNGKTVTFSVESFDEPFLNHLKEYMAITIPVENYILQINGSGMSHMDANFGSTTIFVDLKREFKPQSVEIIGYEQEDRDTFVKRVEAVMSEVNAMNIANRKAQSEILKSLVSELKDSGITLSDTLTKDVGIVKAESADAVAEIIAMEGIKVG